jgi:hypothetical protein
LPLKQSSAIKGRSEVPDALLFADIAAKTQASAQDKSAARFAHGLAILENKARGVPLDRAVGRDEAPSTQILRYLTAAEIQSNRAIRWGVLTDGLVWRLYFTHARSRSEDFLEFDLAAILGLAGQDNLFLNTMPEQHWLKLFMLLFRPQAFVVDGTGQTCLHDRALAEGKLWEARVAQDLSALVFDKIFPTLVQSLITTDSTKPDKLDKSYLTDVKQAALILLYRLLFVLYAEDRDLLPAHDKRYDDYGLRKPIRHHIAERKDKNDTFSDHSSKYYGHLRELFTIIDKGDSSIGIPPYNGGLFHAQAVPLLDRCKLPDTVLAEAIDGLSRREERGRMVYINYRDLSVQQLGSIYERLLEYDVTANAAGITVSPNIFARKGSGSYYTPEELVRLIIERTLAPLIAERKEQFTKAVASSAKTPQAGIALQKHDSALAILDLKICDPAMGSGHFLVSLVDYLADRVLETMSGAEAEAAAMNYQSPLQQNIQTIRNHILAAAKQNRWLVKESQLGDRMLIRRMILKRVIHGVDKNQMAVELAKVALWLHTFTVGAPLSFLDHHLRCGDSLFGEWVRPVMDDFTNRASLLLNSAIQTAQQTAKGMQQVESLTDTDIAEVHLSATTFREVATHTAPTDTLLRMVQALKWAAGKDKVARKAVEHFMSGGHGDPVDILMHGKPLATIKHPLNKLQSASGKKLAAVQEAAALFPDILDKARRIASEQRFLNWEIAFPNIWQQWESTEPTGGFDAVIGNPPWDRLKLEEVEYFAARRPEIALQQRASDRKRMIADLQKQDDPLWHDYAYAAEMAETAALVLRGTAVFRDYPLLSGGDVNLYSLFVERAARLVRRDGLVGLLVPSGIASDLNASAFFKGLATTGRLTALLDFENKGVFFPDVHSGFKFCAFIFGGKDRTVPSTECAFFVHDVAELADPDRCFPLSASDFAAVNPNTGTAPIFRSRRDAELTKRIYAQHPVLVRRNGATEERLYPVKYATMFHMTNDAHLFKKRAELEADGFYPVAGNRLKKGKTEFVPLYEGKMVQAYNHRAANIIINIDNIKRPAQEQPATLEQLADASWMPKPQFMVDEENIQLADKYGWFLGFKHVTATTNVRTMIASILPFCAVGNSMPLLLAEDGRKDEYAEWLSLALANFNSFAFDYVARQKVQGQNFNWYIIEQLPLIAPKAFKQIKIGKTTAEAIVRDEVLHLTYTAHDMATFARDMGYEGAPFAWDEDDRRHRLARLDALFFMLYGLSRDEAGYILGTFPIVRRHDEAAHGRFITRDLILAYMNAFAADDSTSRVALPAI